MMKASTAHQAESSLRYRWPLARLSRALSRPGLCALALVLSLGVSATAFMWQQLSAQRLKAAELSLAQLRLRSGTVAKPEEPARDLDFVQKLPTATSVEAIVRDLQQSGSATGVTVVSVDATTREATERNLGRVEAVTLLRGSYGSIKALLSQVLDRHSNLLVQRLSLRRLNGPTDLEASVTLLQVVQGLAAPDTPR